MLYLSLHIYVVFVQAYLQKVLSVNMDCRLFKQEHTKRFYKITDMNARSHLSIGVFR